MEPAQATARRPVVLEQQLDAVAETGERHEPGDSLWFGQHNVEYFGDGEYWMFDDQTSWATEKNTEKLSNTSRLLIVKVDEEAMVAKIEWAYDIGFYTPHFGDCDKLATGNVLGVGFVGAEIDRKLPNFDMKIMEVTREEQDLVWELTVTGDTEEEYEYGAFNFGWTAYSAERLYNKVLIYNVTCVEYEAGDGTVGTISFTTQNRFKQNYDSEATLTILDMSETEVGSASFNFLPFLMQTDVSIEVEVSQGPVCGAVRLKVENSFGNVNGVDVPASV